MNTAKPKPLPNPLTAHETASYMADVSLQLLKLCRGQGFRALEQIFEMAYYEAYSRANPIEISPENMEELAALTPKPARKRD